MSRLPVDVRVRLRSTAGLVVVAVTLLLVEGSARAQRAPQVGPELSPAEVQQLFDAFVLVQAQDALSLTDAQFAPFVSSLKRLQDVRRRNQQQEQRQLRTLQQMAARTDTSDRELETRLQALDDHRTRAAASVRAAYADVDAVLELRQRIRFRTFELRMERRQMELLMRARNARGGQTQPRRQRPNQTR
jgi:hypothetical protein